MRVLNFGSINLDTVFHVSHFVRPGETIAANRVDQFAGGKGANQSVALARAGASVFHAGAIGADGAWVLDLLRQSGVDTSLIITDPDRATGRAFIQVDEHGENAIVIDAGANHAITLDQIERALAGFRRGELLLLQNEVSAAPALIKAAKRRGLRIALNPAPMDQAVETYPLDEIDILVVNQLEAEALAGVADIHEAGRRLPGRTRIITLGNRGAIAFDGSTVLEVPAPRAPSVDTTAAGDTFVGYFLAAHLEAASLQDAMTRACHAAAVCVSRPGAMSSIPTLDEVRRFSIRREEGPQ